MIHRRGLLAILASLAIAPVAHARSPSDKRPPARKVAKRRPGSTRRQVQAPLARTEISAPAFLVQNLETGETLFERSGQTARPIASISKLMTAIVVLEADQDLEEKISIGLDDVDRLKGTSSRLPVGAVLTRAELLKLALMSSDNRAAHALAGAYPGGLEAFVAQMNFKAKSLGLKTMQFKEPTGLSPANVASPQDLAKLVAQASNYPLIRSYSTERDDVVSVRGKPQSFRNTNSLIRNSLVQAIVSKTGYIQEAGRCLVMRAIINSKPMLIVLLGSPTSQTRAQDALTLKRWVERLG